MLSIQLLQAIVEERERMIQDHMRERRLIRETKADPGRVTGLERAQAGAWRARTPRASATTR
jgi:hypothetical protein